MYVCVFIHELFYRSLGTQIGMRITISNEWASSLNFFISHNANIEHMQSIQKYNASKPNLQIYANYSFDARTIELWIQSPLNLLSESLGICRHQLEIWLHFTSAFVQFAFFAFYSVWHITLSWILRSSSAYIQFSTSPKIHCDRWWSWHTELTDNSFYIPLIISYHDCEYAEYTERTARL